MVDIWSRNPPVFTKFALKNLYLFPFFRTNPAGTRRCKDVGIRSDFGRIGRDKIRRLENFQLQPSCNVNPTSESDVIPTSHWRQMSAGNISFFIWS